WLVGLQSDVDDVEVLAACRKEHRVVCQYARCLFAPTFPRNRAISLVIIQFRPEQLFEWGLSFKVLQEIENGLLALGLWRGQLQPPFWHRFPSNARNAARCMSLWGKTTTEGTKRMRQCQDREVAGGA